MQKSSLMHACGLKGERVQRGHAIINKGDLDFGKGPELPPKFGFVRLDQYAKILCRPEMRSLFHSFIHTDTQVSKFQIVVQNNHLSIV